MNEAQREEQMKQAEEILGDKLQEVGFAKGLFFGQFLGEKLLPYPGYFAPGAGEPAGGGFAAVLCG